MFSFRYDTSIKKRNLSFSSAFTVIELIVVLVLIAMLAAIIGIAYTGWRQSTTVTQIKNDLSGASSAMENYRIFNNNYPTDVTTLTTINQSDGVTISGGSEDGGETFCIEAISAQLPGTYYHIDSTNSVVGAEPGECTTPQYTLTLIAGTGGTVGGAGTYDINSPQTITATPDSYYSFVDWTGDAGCSGAASHSITMDANKTCTASFTPTPIAAPSTPSVSQNTVGSTTTWSWGAASCPGNSARYQYRYTITPSGYDSGWTPYSSTSVGFTTSAESQTYDVAVQAQCYNVVASSSWSASGSASYYRPPSGPPTIVVGTQTWMLYNLDVGTKLNPGAQMSNNAVVEKYCYGGLDSNCTTYGGFYQWNEAMQYSTTEGVQGICPTGFHIPTDTEIKTLEKSQGMTQAQADATGDRGTVAGAQLRAGGGSGWNGLMGGKTAINGNPSYYIVDDGTFWSSTQQSGTLAWNRTLYRSGISNAINRWYEYKTYGVQVRCIRN